MIAAGRVSLRAFIAGLTGLAVTLLVNDCILSWVVLLLYFIGLSFFMWLTQPSDLFQVGLRAAFLGCGCVFGLLLTLTLGFGELLFGLYIIIMCIFHYSEYLVTAITNPRSLSLDSFLLNHSVAYGVAAVMCSVEFFLEAWLWPGLKRHWVLSAMGIVLVISGEVLRKAAMFTARTNFNHIVQTSREEGHVLVTHGVYSFCRHPSYVGWFWWSVGAQLMLCNPICTVAYACISWSFFNNRVQIEEITLIHFFREDYLRYQKLVPTGLPFIQGYKVNYHG